MSRQRWRWAPIITSLRNSRGIQPLPLLEYCSSAIRPAADHFWIAAPFSGNHLTSAEHFVCLLCRELYRPPLSIPTPVTAISAGRSQSRAETSERPSFIAPREALAPANIDERPFCCFFSSFAWSAGSCGG